MTPATLNPIVTVENRMSRTPHDQFFPRRAQIGPGLQPTSTDLHDILLIPPAPKNDAPATTPEEFYRFAVVKVTDGALRRGTYPHAPEVWNRNDVGQRKVYGIAHPEQVQSYGTSSDARGPAFAVMPIKPEPGSSSCAFCYLINAQQVLSPNAWTAEEWNAPGGPDFDAEANANRTEVEVLLALPRGIVLRLRVTDLHRLDTFPARATVATATADGVTYELEPVALKNESEIWGELRNGCIAGRVFHRQRDRVIPLLNVTALMRPQAAAGVAP
jgi:hypothetical protein